MNTIIKFLRYRKQNDSIKIVIILILIILYFVVYSVVTAAKYMQSENADYQFICTFSGDSEIKLNQTEDIASYSRFIAKNVQISEENLGIKCVSADYISNFTDIQNIDRNTVLLSQKSFSKLFPNEENYHQSECILDGKKTILYFQLCEKIDDNSDSGYALSSESELKKSDLMIVNIPKNSSENAEYILSQLGFSIQNREQILSQKFEQEKFLSNLKYSLISILTAALGIFGIRTEMKNNRR